MLDDTIPLMEVASHLDRDRLSITLAGAALGYTLSRVIQLPTRRFGLQVLGSALGIELSTGWLLALFVVGLVVTGVQILYLRHPACQEERPLSLWVYWVLPGLAALALGGILQQVDDLRLWALAMLGGVLALGVVITSEYHALDPAELATPGRQLFSTVLVYLVTWALLSQVFAARARILLAGPAAFLITALLAARLLLHSGQARRQLVLYSGVLALLLTQILWVLNYWRIGLLAGGLALLLAFYLLVSLVQQAWLGRLGKRSWIEYAVTVALAVLVISQV
jgi:hypothetical protein